MNFRTGREWKEWKGKEEEGRARQGRGGKARKHGIVGLFYVSIQVQRSGRIP